MSNIFISLSCLFMTGLVYGQKTGSLEEAGEVKQESGFVAGTHIIFSDNFSKDAVGDFPAKWNSTRTGEVKKLKSFPGNFLKISDGTVVNPQLTQLLPENFTVEFDLIVPGDVPIRMAGFGFGTKPFVISNLLTSKDGIVFSFHSNDKNYAPGLKFGTKNSTNTKPGLQSIDFTTPLNSILKCAIAVNKTRIRLFVNGTKMVDMPTAFAPSFRKSLFFCPSTHGHADSKLNYFYISNLVIAEAGTDRRSQVIKELMEKGSASTTAIQFATNSDVINTSSDEVLSQIASGLKENPKLYIKIVGHTDSDGDEARNLGLSKKRAEAVKKALSTRFGIATNRMTTDGKGESEPVAANTTATGKASNRRVEFIRQEK